MSKTYNVSRETAAELLNVSTRTIDRYVKSGKLSYKKVANKVLLTQEEINSMQEDFQALRQESQSEIVSNNANNKSLATHHKDGSVNLANIDEKIDKFFLIFNEKDKMLEEKNKLIFMLQQRIGELETKIQHMVALPEYNKEKQTAVIEKERLEQKLQQLQG